MTDDQRTGPKLSPIPPIALAPFGRLVVVALTPCFFVAWAAFVRGGFSLPAQLSLLGNLHVSNYVIWHKNQSVAQDVGNVPDRLWGMDATIEPRISYFGYAARNEAHKIELRLPSVLSSASPSVVNRDPLVNRRLSFVL
jgi:hypothetical protein